MIILDTNVISELLRPQPDSSVLYWVKQLQQPVAITTITVAELLAGVHRLPAGKRKTELQQSISILIDQYLSAGAILSFDLAAAKQYGELLAKNLSSGKPISAMDCEIAAICAAHDATLATRNVKDFARCELPIYNPWESGAGPR